jgi:iron only hydrogenase large subunit-like protein
MKRSDLQFPLKGNYLVMVAPSFIVDFKYPKIISQLRCLGFDKVVEVTFGAKMINKEYHKKLKSSKDLVVSSVCPGIVEVVKNKFPNYKKNLILVDSPMIAMAKICKKIYPKHQIVFLSPCNYKKIEAKQSKFVDHVVDFKELSLLFKKFNTNKNCNNQFDKFYNDYTKVYPLSGGLSKTAHLGGILKPEEVLIVDGIKEVFNFLKKPIPNVKFLDVTFCKGGCVGGPCINSKAPLMIKKMKVRGYLKKSKREDIPEEKKGLVGKAKGISFLKKNF